MTLSLFRPRVRKLTAAVLLSTWLAPLPLPVLAQAVASSPPASVNPGLGSAAAADQVQSNLNRSVQIGRQSPYLPKEPTVIDAPTYELPDMGDPSTAALSPPAPLLWLTVDDRSLAVRTSQQSPRRLRLPTRDDPSPGGE